MGTKYLAVFVLGSPSTLRLIERETAREEIIFENIGRALYSLPDSSGFTFTERREGKPFLIRHLDIASRRVTEIFPLPGENEHYALMRDQDAKLGVRFIAGDKNKLYSRSIDDKAWQEIASFDTQGVNAISRLAVSPDGRYIAIVNRE